LLRKGGKGRLIYCLKDSLLEDAEGKHIAPTQAYETESRREEGTP